MKIFVTQNYLHYPIRRLRKSVDKCLAERYDLIRIFRRRRIG
jgi:hypothetical protein